MERCFTGCLQKTDFLILLLAVHTCRQFCARTGHLPFTLFLSDVSRRLIWNGRAVPPERAHRFTGFCKLSLHSGSMQIRTHLFPSFLSNCTQRAHGSLS